MFYYTFNVPLIQELIRISFETVDTDQNGLIDYEEFRTWYEMRSVNQETTKVSHFSLLDKVRMAVIRDFQQEQRHLLLISHHNSMSNVL